MNTRYRISAARLPLGLLIPVSAVAQVPSIEQPQSGPPGQRAAAAFYDPARLPGFSGNELSSPIGRVLEVRALGPSRTDLTPVDGPRPPVARGRPGAARPDVPIDWPEEDLPSAVARLEEMLIRRALARCSGNRSEAAKTLGINRQLLYAKLKNMGLRSTMTRSIWTIERCVSLSVSLE